MVSPRSTYCSRVTLLMPPNAYCTPSMSRTAEGRSSSKRARSVAGRRAVECASRMVSMRRIWNSSARALSGAVIHHCSPRRSMAIGGRFCRVSVIRETAAALMSDSGARAASSRDGVRQASQASSAIAVISATLSSQPRFIVLCPRVISARCAGATIPQRRLRRTAAAVRTARQTRSDRAGCCRFRSGYQRRAAHRW